MDFRHEPYVVDLQERLTAFMDQEVRPREADYYAAIEASGDPHHHPAFIDDLKEKARDAGLWNLFLPHKTEWTDGLSNLAYAPLAEIMGTIWWASEIFNCSAPDTGNMELLTMFGTAEQQERWLKPLLHGEIRSAFAMTEPAVASSDATNVQCEIRRDGDEYVINGRKWWISGAADERCEIFIVMGKTDPSAPKHRQQSMVLVPRNTPGVTIVRSLKVLGYQHQEGHCEIVFDDVRVPASNLIGEEGGGFAIAQARLGPGRIHHCMRSIGAAERALELMRERVKARVAFGRPLAEQGVVRQWIADSRMEIDQARLLTLHAAWMMDEYDNKRAKSEIAAIKVVVPSMTQRVIDRAIQAHGGGGLSQDFPLAEMFGIARTLRLADGPDEVHRNAIAKLELQREPRMVVPA